MSVVEPSGCGYSAWRDQQQVREPVGARYAKVLAVAAAAMIPVVAACSDSEVELTGGAGSRAAPAAERHARTDVSGVRRHHRPDGGPTDQGHRPGEHRPQLGRLPVAGRVAASSGRTSRSPGTAAARSGGNARPRNCPAPASRTSTSRVTAVSSPWARTRRSATICARSASSSRTTSSNGRSASARSRTRDPCDVAKELTRQSIVNSK